MNKKKIQSTKKLILTNVRLYNLSLTIYKCTENICTDSEILTYKAYNFRSPIAHQSLTNQELLELTTSKRSEKKNKRDERTLIGNADCSFNKVLCHTVTVRFSIPSV